MRLSANDAEDVASRARALRLTYFPLEFAASYPNDPTGWLSSSSRVVVFGDRCLLGSLMGSQPCLEAGEHSS